MPAFSHGPFFFARSEGRAVEAVCRRRQQRNGTEVDAVCRAVKRQQAERYRSGHCMPSSEKTVTGKRRTPPDINKAEADTKYRKYRKGGISAFFLIVCRCSICVFPLYEKTARTSVPLFPRYFFASPHVLRFFCFKDSPAYGAQIPPQRRLPVGRVQQQVAYLPAPVNGEGTVS